jgi:hypothetical protein
MLGIPVATIKLWSYILTIVGGLAAVIQLAMKAFPHSKGHQALS